MFTKTMLSLAALTSSVLAAPGKIPGAGWTVKDFTRSYDTYSHSETYTFKISAGGYTPDFTCTITDHAYGYADPKTQSWYSVPCNGGNGADGGWEISWGYNPAYDSAVMTVLSKPLGQDAWFGWNSVSSTTKLPDVGPNPVYAIGTFD